MAVAIPGLKTNVDTHTIFAISTDLKAQELITEAIPVKLYRHVNISFSHCKCMFTPSCKRVIKAFLYIRRTTGYIMSWHCPWLRSSARPSVCLSVNFVSAPYLSRRLKVFLKLCSDVRHTRTIYRTQKSVLSSEGQCYTSSKFKRQHFFVRTKTYKPFMGWLGEAKVSCSLPHWGVQLRLTYKARPAVLVAGKGRRGIFVFVCFFTFIHFPLSPLSLSFISSTILSLFSQKNYLSSPFLWETTQNDPQGRHVV